MKFFLPLLQILFAGSFLFSAYTKAIAPGYFDLTLMDQGLAPTREIAAYLTRFFIGLETALGLLLLWPRYQRVALGFSLFLLAGFTVQLGFLWFMGSTENCGCFGEMIALSPKESILKNILLMAMATFLLLQTKRVKIQFKPPVLLLLLCWMGSQMLLPMPNHKTFRFAEYSRFEGHGRIDLAQGEHLVAVFNLDCVHCQEVAALMGQLEKKHQKITLLFVLFYQEGKTTVSDFKTKTLTDFPYTFIDAHTFFDLIGQAPPRIYHLKAGEVLAYWDSDFESALQASGMLDEAFLAK